MNQWEFMDKEYIWHPFTQMKGWNENKQLVIDHGEGVKLYDVEGNAYYDGISSLWVNIHGHRRREIDEAVKKQLDKIAHTTLLGLINKPSAELAKKLVEVTPKGLNKVFYSDDGSTAVEAAVKIAFQYWQHKGLPEKQQFINLGDSYHGDTVGAVSVGNIDVFHKVYKPLLFNTKKMTCPSFYHSSIEGINSEIEFRDFLLQELEDYLKDYPDSRLIVIDTLQKVRTASKDNAYASDYGDISLIKDFADRHSLAVIVVHHIRKQNDSDVFNKVSGTTGLTGSADATFVLEKEKRASDTAKLYVTGRDTPYQEYTLRFRDCSWELVERKTQEQLAKETIPDVLFRLVDFMRDKEEWIGTATELLAAMGETETIPTVITKWLNEYRTTFLSENRICYQYSRRKDGRQIALARRAGDSGDGGDSDIGIPPVTVIDA